MSEKKTENTAESAKPFILVRTFNAPRTLVFDAWTKQEHLTKWFGPKGFALKGGTVDLRPGGVYHYCMTAPNGAEMWGKWTFREVVRPERLVLVNSFSDAAGGLTRHPYSPTWPLETLSQTDFSEEDAKTTIRLEWRAINATETERDTFDSAHDGMGKGWGGTMDQLTEYLSTIQTS